MSCPDVLNSTSSVLSANVPYNVLDLLSKAIARPLLPPPGIWNDVNRFPRSAGWTVVDVRSGAACGERQYLTMPLTVTWTVVAPDGIGTSAWKDDGPPSSAAPFGPWPSSGSTGIPKSSNVVPGDEHELPFERRRCVVLFGSPCV